jgi:hypothetical protein
MNDEMMRKIENHLTQYGLNPEPDRDRDASGMILEPGTFGITCYFLALPV